MTMFPRVSVVMTTYNGSQFVKETIDSILNQSFSDFEFIIIDDNSTDETFEIIKGYNDRRLRIYRNSQNLGVGATRNRGINLANGDYLAYTDQDDISLPQRLERQVDFLDNNPAVILAGTAGWFLFAKNNSTIPYSAVQKPYVMHWGLLTQTRLVPSSTCVRLETLRRHGIYFRPEYNYADDFDLFHRLAQVGDVVSMPDRLTIYRIHENNNTIHYAAEMETNGKRLLSEVYYNFLGLDLNSSDIDCTWRVFNLVEPARSREDLLRAGELLQMLMRAYLKTKKLNNLQVQEVKAFASTDWWLAVSKTARVLGRPRIIKYYKEFPELSVTSPPFIEMGRTLAISALGPRVIDRLRRFR